MLIALKGKKNNKVVVKDALDIDFDMSIEQKEDGKYYVSVNNSYYLRDNYDKEIDAENEMLNIADARNKLESDLLSHF